MMIRRALILLILLVQANSNAQVPILRSLIPATIVIDRDGVEWKAPNFKNQKQALGLEDGTFQPSQNMEKATAFWIKIYTQLKTTQGVIHDVENLNVVYEKIDFDFINKDSTLDEKQKAKARDSHLEERKNAILESLTKIASEDGDIKLTAFDESIKTLWDKEGGMDGIKKAANPARIRFQLGQSDRIKEAIFLSGKYLPMMEKIFREEGLPIQLTRLVFVESSFDVSARSKVGASGLWQIMPSAARGRLKMNKVYDLRNHPFRATELAARMLKFNYQMLGAWPLAVTGYNHGPYGVKRLVEKYNTRDLGEIILRGESGSFGFASRNFYASFLAALEVESHASTYFPGIRRAPEVPLEELNIPKPIYFRDLVKAFGGDRDLAQQVNPHLNSLAYADNFGLDSKSHLMIPKNLQKKAEKLLASLGHENMKMGSMLRKPSSSKGEDASQKKKTKERFHTVALGETLFRISVKYGVSVESLLALNKITDPGTIKVGQTLILP